MSKTMYMCLNVRGALRNMTKREKRGMFKHDDGRTMTADEADDALMDELVKGHEVIPMSTTCGNPCSYASCTGFDYGPEGGCPGHATDELPKDPG
jgi:hypothetical protein